MTNLMPFTFLYRYQKSLIIFLLSLVFSLVAPIVSTTLTASASPPGAFTLSGTAYCNTSPPPAPAVQLSWTASSGATSYDLYRNGSLYTSGLTGTSFDNNANVAAGQTYTYYVAARNATGTTQSNTIHGRRAEHGVWKFLPAADYQREPKPGAWLE